MRMYHLCVGAVPIREAGQRRDKHVCAIYIDTLMADESLLCADWHTEDDRSDNELNWT
jgi:hypothetical protein